MHRQGTHAVVEEIRQAGGHAAYTHADIGEPAEIEKMIAFATDRFGRLDILHNNTLFTVVARIGDLSLEGWKKTVDVSLTGCWYAIKIALGPMLTQGKGVIINTASVSGLTGDYTLGAYNAVKAGVVNMSRVSGIEYARKGIRCNAICPGPILTPTAEAAGRKSSRSLCADQRRHSHGAVW